MSENKSREKAGQDMMLSMFMGAVIIGIVGCGLTASIVFISLPTFSIASLIDNTVCLKVGLGLGVAAFGSFITGLAAAVFTGRGKYCFLFSLACFGLSSGLMANAIISHIFNYIGIGR